MQYTCSIEAFNRSRSHRVNACMVTTPGHALHRSPDADSANPTNQEAVYGLVVVYGIKIMRSPYTYTDEKMVVYGLMQATAYGMRGSAWRDAWHILPQTQH